MDVNTPVTNPSLVCALEAIQKELTPDTNRTFLTELKKARFLSPVHIDPKPPAAGADGGAVLPADTTISFEACTYENGDVYMPVYTDWGALKLWRDIPGEQTLITSYDDISRMVLTSKNPNSKGFIINPYSHRVPVSKSTIEQISGAAHVEWTAEKDTQVLIGAPANDPIAMKTAIANYLKGQKNVNSAYLALMENSGEFSFIIAVDFAGNRQATFNGIAAVAIPHLREGELIDITPADTPLGKDVIGTVRPFYKRKAFGLF
ncbi:MAG: enhanced serine sensitivity protein SseB [Oscillospiraceae bacterium]|jgi:hypothetical protein|nr:enhanced serine sensitivity protein SseB [Oscillospiraceae bacterium]